MHLSHLTFTGADDDTDMSRLSALSRKAPLIEWGLAIAADLDGRPGHPSAEWRDRFAESAPNARRSAHLRGTGMLESMQHAALRPLSPLGTELRATVDGLPRYGRVQLEFDAERTPLPVVSGVVADWRQGRWKRTDGTPIELITQHKLCNWSVHALFIASGSPQLYPDWYSIVFDESGGDGWLPLRWPDPLIGLRCGYAGDLEPQDIADHVRELAGQLPDDANVWIEFDQGVKTESRFDLQKVADTIAALRTAVGDAPLVPGLYVPASERVSASMAFTA